MSKTLSVAAAASFEAMVKQAYQGGTKVKLTPTIRKRMNKGVNSFIFNKMGAGIAQERSSQTTRKLMNVDHTRVTANVSEWEAAELTDIFDNAETPIEEMQELAQTVAKAINRREDQLIIDAAQDSGTSNIVSTAIGGTDTSLNVDKLIEMGKIFDGFEIDEDRHFAGHANAKAGLMAETQATSSDFNSVRALVNGTINSFYGFEFHWFGNRVEGGIIKVSNDRKNFAYAGKEAGAALGIGIVMDKAPITTFENTLGSWLTAQDFIAGAIAIDAEGIIEVNTFEA